MSEETIFREVDEEVRQEQLQKLWEKYGGLFIAAALAIVLGVAGAKGWKAWTKSRIEASGAGFAAAVDLARQGKTGEASGQLASIINSGSGGYPALARLMMADLEGKDAATRVKSLDAIVSDTSIDKTLRSVAAIRAAYARLDDADEAEMARRLKQYNDGHSPWRHLAREALGLSSWKAGNYKKADGFFTSILADSGSPRDIQDRARQMRALIAPHLTAETPPK